MKARLAGGLLVWHRMVRGLLLAIALASLGVAGAPARADRGLCPGKGGKPVAGSARSGGQSVVRPVRSQSSRRKKTGRSSPVVRKRNGSWVKRSQPRSGAKGYRQLKAKSPRAQSISRLRFRSGKKVRPVELVLFDLDGTVADTRDDIIQHLDHGFQAVGIRLNKEQLAPLLDGSPLQVTFEAVVADPQPGQLETFVDAVVRSQAEAPPLATLFPGMTQVLKKLSREPGVKVGLATARNVDSAEKILTSLGVRHYFDIVTGSGESTIKPKPAPDLLLHAAGELGVAPERAIMVGDTDHDIGAGRAAGMGTVAMNGINLNRVVRETPDQSTTDMRRLLTYLGLSSSKSVKRRRHGQRSVPRSAAGSTRK